MIKFTKLYHRHKIKDEGMAIPMSVIIFAKMPVTSRIVNSKTEVTEWQYFFSINLWLVVIDYYWKK